MRLPDECTTCATCCFSESTRHVRVTGDDYERLGDDAEAWVTWLGNEAYLSLADVAGSGGTLHACAALRVDAASGRMLCAIYERRPDVCRALERGSKECYGELATKGERPARALVLASALTRRP